MISFDDARHKLIKLCADMSISMRADCSKYPMRVTVRYSEEDQTEFQLLKDGSLLMIPRWESGVPAADHQKIQKAVQDFMIAWAVMFFASVKITGKLPDEDQEKADFPRGEDDE